MLSYALAIKALADLTDKLDGLLTDRKQREAFLPLKEASATVQMEHLKAERQHSEEIERLKADHAQAMENLKSEHLQALTNLETKYLAIVADLRSQIPEFHSIVLSEAHKDILLTLSKHDGSTDTDISNATALPLFTVQHHLEELRLADYVSADDRQELADVFNNQRKPTRWHIEHRGRSFLIEHQET